MSPLSNRVINLEAQAERRWEQGIAERLATIEGVPVAEVLGWLAETRAERAEKVRASRGRRFVLSDVVRGMAEEAGLDEHETEQAIAEAERVLHLLEAAP